MAIALAAVCFLVGRLTWEARDTAGKSQKISAAQISEVGSASEIAQRNKGPAPLDPESQRLLDRYGDLQCRDFGSQQEAQAVFELDQILFGTSTA